jgi:ABC-type nickel/cobalt efflux system permease component RcnA
MQRTMIMPPVARLLAAVAALFLLSWSALAQQQGPPAKSPFGVGPPAAERPFTPPRPGTEAAAPAGPMQGLWLWVLEKQALAHRELASAVRRFKSADPFSAALLLAGISFAYGVLHAVGPGHGKAVISSYVLADGRTVRRGVLLSFLAAAIQAVSALVLVGVLILLLRSTGLQIKAMEAWLETLSWGLVALVGAWLLYYQLRAAIAPAHAHAHNHGHGHTHSHGDHHHDHAHAHPAHDASHGHNHHHHHHDASCEVCAHLPAPSELQGDLSWRRAFALAFAVGIRPCTGAILVLVFAIGQGLWWAGVFSTFAMALGTAITVSVLAAMAVGFREVAKRVAGGESSKWAGRVQLAAGLGGASLVLVLGAVFFVSSLGGVQPL